MGMCLSKLCSPAASTAVTNPAPKKSKQTPSNLLPRSELKEERKEEEKQSSQLFAAGSIAPATTSNQINAIKPAFIICEPGQAPVEFYLPYPNKLFYKSIGDNSGMPGTLLPSRGFDKNSNKIQKPYLADEFADKVGTAFATRSLHATTLNDALIQSFENKELIEVFLQTLEQDENLQLPNITPLQQHEGSPSSNQSFTLAQQFYRAHKFTFQQLTRFQDLNSMLISCTLGGGFWNDSANEKFTSWFKQTYAQQIKQIQAEIQANPADITLTEELSMDDAMQVLSSNKYSRPKPEYVNVLVQESSQEYFQVLE